MTGEIEAVWLDDEHGWIMDSSGNYLAEIVTKDEEGRALPPDEIQEKIESIVRAYNVHDELLEEHKAWAKNIGEALVRAMQGDYGLIDILAKTTNVEFPDGEPRLKSEAITNAEG